MKKLLFAFVPALLAMTLVPVKWNVQASGVKISFDLPQQHKTGTINGLDADIQFDPADPLSSKISVKADVKTLDAHNWGLTTHLLSADYFHSGKYPVITFVSSSIVKTDSGFTATGDLTIKDKTRPVVIPFKFIGSDTASWFKGKMTIFCGDFGLIHEKENDPSTQTDITIEVPVKK